MSIDIIVMGERGVYVDWAAIKTEYITADTTYRNLAAKYGVSLSQIGRVATKENWVELKRQYADKVLTETVNKVAGIEADHNTRLFNVAGKLLSAIEKKLETPMLENGQAMAQEYRQIASTIKDIKDIQGIKSDLDAEEQRARIDNLRQQKNPSTVHR